MISTMSPAGLTVLSPAFAFMRFSQSAFSQDENVSPLSVSLVLDPFGGSGSGSAAITQDILQQIIAFSQGGNTATGREVMWVRISKFSDGHVFCMLLLVENLEVYVQNEFVKEIKISSHNRWRFGCWWRLHWYYMSDYLYCWKWTWGLFNTTMFHHH